ncbi:uncharacterized protein LOC121518354 [Cheilinus undulatus]|uniref:uncharacterized protein LOC121518354 n=1 Tax=Cheilinus undulatus TaxID=241271 RepID=UPI001BD48765|nr:uncharacterized protein LOC121518354 [Cheilinus undulatus]
MDNISEYIWQRRIHHGVRYQKTETPFPESVAAGLEFNAALDREEKLDLSLLTNAIMLELCEFARCVTRSEGYFLFDILEFNFDLGVDPDNERQCLEYQRRILNRLRVVKGQIKFKPHRWKESFPLPELSELRVSAGSEQEIKCPKVKKMLDISVLTAGSKDSDSSENKTESNGAVSSAFTIKKKGVGLLQITADSFPNCKDLGVTLFVRPENARKEKLDPNLLTKGVMIELLDLCKAMRGTMTDIVYDLVKQNFGYEFDQMLFRIQLAKIVQKKYPFQNSEDRDALRREPFLFQSKREDRLGKKRRNSTKEVEKLTMASKRWSPHNESDRTEIWKDGELSYMCPVDFETEMQSDMEKEPENPAETTSAADEETMLNVVVKQEEEEMFISSVQPQENGVGCKVDFKVDPDHTTTMVPTVVSDPTAIMNPPADVKPRAGLEPSPGLDPTAVLEPKGVLDATAVLDPTAALEPSAIWDLRKNENMNAKTPKQRLWMRRTTRSKQILSSSRVKDLFANCKAIGLDFSVGSGDKQSMDLQLFTNGVMWEVYRFATAMKKSMHSFSLETFDNNFNIFLQDEQHQRNFTVYMAAKERILLNNPSRHRMEFLSSPCKIPEFYNMVDVTGDFQTDESQPQEQQINLDSVGFDPTQQEDSDLHPFCRKIGLNLWSTDRRPTSQKLDLTVLTNGAMLEICSLVRDLCGTVHETVNDILEHNFDLDLQSGKTTEAKAIQRWYGKQKTLMVRANYKSKMKIDMWLKMPVALDPQSKSGQQTFGKYQKNLGPEHLTPGGEKFFAFSGNAKKVKSSYGTCKEIGLVLDVGAKPGAKRKLDLRVLTRRILLEIHEYVLRNSNHYVPALYHILEYNFDLSSQNHRKVEFAWSIASQVLIIAGKNNRKGNYLNKNVDLPLEFPQSSWSVCKEEPEDGNPELDLSCNSEIMFVKELKPVDIEVEIM